MPSLLSLGTLSKLIFMQALSAQAHKSKSSEQGIRKAEVRTVRGEGSTSHQTEVVAGAGAHVGLARSRLPPKPARGPRTGFWAVSKDTFSINDLILQNSPRVSKCSGKHHFDKLESGRHCWSHNVGGGHKGPSLGSPKRSRCR